MRSFIDERGEILFNIDILPFECKYCDFRGKFCSTLHKHMKVKHSKQAS